MVVPLASVARAGHSLEGTRLTLVRVPGQPEAVEFSIRTPVTPPRCEGGACGRICVCVCVVCVCVEGE